MSAGGGAGGGGPTDAGVESFDLTPMIDVVLLLIIFFMLSSQFAAIELWPVDLPVERGEGDAKPPEMSLFIDLAEDGSLSVMGRPVSRPEAMELVTASARAHSASDGFEVIVRPDREALSEHLNRLAADLAGAGVRSWRIATDAQGAPGGAP